MLVEAIGPLLVRLPEKDIRLVPGIPTELAPRYVHRLLRAGKVRLVLSTALDWLALWRFVAFVSDGLLPTDPRLPVVLVAMTACDRAFELGDKAAFLEAVEGVVQAMHTEMGKAQ